MWVAEMQFQMKRLWVQNLVMITSRHIITHYISKEVLDKTIEHTKKVITIFKDYFASAPMTSMVFSDSSKFNQIDYSKYGMSKSKFKQYLRDACLSRIWC